MVTTEIREIGRFLGRNRQEAIVIALAGLFLALGEYHSIGSRWADSLLFYGALPIIAILLMLRRNPLDFGLRIGNYRIWGLHVVAACLVAVPILFIASYFASLEDYYTIQDFTLPAYLWQTLLYQSGWEFIFRGFILFGLKERLNEGSILIQMIPFLILHLDKPEIEAISTIPMGIYFGYVAYRGGSYWPAVFIHVFINVLFRVLVNWY
ncbi:MAG: CPBP family intramembrane glutamic endopeptidase [Dehalococcoidia bacterium]